MVDLYSFVDVNDDLKDKIHPLEEVFIRVSKQTTECGIFIQRYTSDAGEMGGVDLCYAWLMFERSRSLYNRGNEKCRISPLEIPTEAEGGACFRGDITCRVCFGSGVSLYSEARCESSHLVTQHNP